MDLGSFIHRRFDYVLNTLMAAGYELDPEPRETNEWTDLWPDGIARLKTVWLPHSDSDPDADPDERVSFSVVEHWTPHEPGDSYFEEEGLWLARYSYNGYCAVPDPRDGRGNHRHDFHEGHNDRPYHLHPFGEPDDVMRSKEAPITLPEAIADFGGVVRDLVARGTLKQ